MRNVLQCILAIVCVVTVVLQNITFAIGQAEAVGQVRSASVGKVVFDFETEAEIKCWHDEHKTTISGKTLKRVRKFATSGHYSMEFCTPKWKKGMPQWPAFECVPPVRDWSGYDRLVFDVTNVSPERQMLLMFISDSHTKTRKGLHHRAALEPLSYTQVVVDIADGFRAKGIDSSDINVIHFFTTRPPADMCVYIDRMILLKKGDKLPLPNEGYKRDFIKLQAKALEKLKERIAANKKWVDDIRSKSNFPDWLIREYSNLQRDGVKLLNIVSGGELSMRSVIELPNMIREKISSFERAEGLGNLWQRFSAIAQSARPSGVARSDVIAGFATSMQKILPKQGKLDDEIKIARTISISLAKREKEAFQVVVIPYNSDLSSVSVKVGRLVNDKGVSFEGKNIRAVPMGYVKTKTVPPYGSSYVGWWPDPILDFMKETDVAKGVAQAFWVRVCADAGQQGGVYRGTLTVCEEGKPILQFAMSVRVYDFAVPACSPLPLAITFCPHDHPIAGTKSYQYKWRKEPEYPINIWKKHKRQWAEFLSDYYITFDSLYEYPGWSPYFEMLKELKEEGRLGRFNLGYFSPAPAESSKLKHWREKVIGRIKSRYERAKSDGLIDYAYIYGCDECTSDKFAGLERAAKLLKQAFPDVMVMTTSYDLSYGLESSVKSIDAWCPLIVNYDKNKADKARLAGKQVWWYICCSPHHPYPNMFVEYPAIEGRLLMGAMTAKYRPDGFLYYQISIWNSHRPITSGPFTDWEPRSWSNYNGDGSWTCVGPDGVPLATIRLENFRDGLEDYAYFKELEKDIRLMEGKKGGLSSAEKNWLLEAKSAIAVPGSLVSSLTKYSRNPERVYAWRNHIGELAERYNRLEKSGRE